MLLEYRKRVGQIVKLLLVVVQCCCLLLICYISSGDGSRHWRNVLLKVAYYAPSGARGNFAKILPEFPSSKG